MTRSRGSIAVACVAALAAALLPNSAARGEPISTRSLLRDLTDLDRLAEFPSPAYTTKQSSSRDPVSTTPADPATWFANGDFSNYHGEVERDGRRERVMFRADGPGAVMHIWSANPAGTLRVYIDGAREPALVGPMERLLGGATPGLPEPLAGVQGKGFNLYLPMPYARSCEITVEGKGAYYTVAYRTYAAGTAITSFASADVERLSADIQRQARALANPHGAVEVPRDATQPFDVSLDPGATVALGTLSGQRAITSLRARLPESIDETALRAVVLRMTFDGQRTVEVPLGDFFASAPGVNPYAGLPMGVTKARELWSRWPMPFRESAAIELRNLGDAPVKLSGEIASVARAWGERTMHFHAGFRAEAGLATRPMSDWNYLTVAGKGRFVGTALQIDNPVKAWWGEGDEKFYVDGEREPSWFGTGTEDYFNYAWCWPGVFEHAYHSQPRCDGPANYGRTSVNRFHIVDDVPFTRAFKFDMELWHWRNTRVNLAATTYWYAQPGATRTLADLTPRDLAVHPLPAYRPFVAEGAIEGESMQVLASTGVVETQEWDELSRDRQLWWRGAKQGDELRVRFDVPTAGRYRVSGRFLKGADYGIHALAINGQRAGTPINSYSDGVEPTPEFDLGGEFDLTAGPNTLTVTAVGTDPTGQRQYLFGLDYLKLYPTR